MQVSDVIKVVSADTFERPIYAGNAIETVQATDAKKVLTIRTAGFGVAGGVGVVMGSAPGSVVAAGGDAGRRRLRPPRPRRNRPDGPDRAARDVRADLVRDALSRL